MFRVRGSTLCKSYIRGNDFYTFGGEKMFTPFQIYVQNIFKRDSVLNKSIHKNFFNEHINKSRVIMKI